MEFDELLEIISKKKKETVECLKQELERILKAAKETPAALNLSYFSVEVSKKNSILSSLDRLIIPRKVEVSPEFYGLKKELFVKGLPGQPGNSNQVESASKKRPLEHISPKLLSKARSNSKNLFTNYLTGPHERNYELLFPRSPSPKSPLKTRKQTQKEKVRQFKSLNTSGTESISSVLLQNRAGLAKKDQTGKREVGGDIRTSCERMLKQMVRIPTSSLTHAATANSFRSHSNLRSSIK